MKLLKELQHDSVMINNRIISTNTISEVSVDDSAIALRVEYSCGESYLFKFSTLEECYEELDRVINYIDYNKE